MMLRFTPDEAAAYLAVRVAFGDMKLRKEEIVEIAKHYPQSLIQAAVMKSEDFKSQEEADDEAISILKNTPREKQIEALKIGLAVSSADGDIDIRETRILSKYADAFGVSSLDIIQSL